MIPPCSIVASIPPALLRCAGRRAGATIAVLDGFCAEREEA
jgi:hypothetical protein